jgi:small-conductance mechanosensitive channel
VISDINFAIDAAFREKGIEIPFPQRDVNFRGPLQIERNPAAQTRRS